MTRKPFALPDSNPKSAYGTAKPGIHGIPVVALLHCGNGMRDGVVKYGLTNWRENSVAASVYYNAAFRHLASWWDGEQEAEDSGVHHLGHVMACCAILLDAEAQGNLIDDRPSVPGKFSEMVKAMTQTTAPREPGACGASDLGRDADEAETLEQIMGADWPAESPSWDDFPDWMDFCRTIQFDDEGELDEETAEWLTATVNAIRGAENVSHACEELVEAILATNEEPGWDDTSVEQDTQIAQAQQAEQSDLGLAGGIVDHFDDGLATFHLSAPDTEKQFDVSIRFGVTHPEMHEIVTRFLAGDLAQKHMAVFNNARTHIGSFQTSLYKQSDRTRLAFYLEAYGSGAEFPLTEMDNILKAAGLSW